LGDLFLCLAPKYQKIHINIKFINLKLRVLEGIRLQNPINFIRIAGWAYEFQFLCYSKSEYSLPMNRLKMVVRMLETASAALKNEQVDKTEYLKLLNKHSKSPYSQLARELHGDNLISADTLFTVTRNLDQLRQTLKEAVEQNQREEELDRTCALVEHKLEILRLNFINAVNNLTQSTTNTA